MLFSKLIFFEYLFYFGFIRYDECRQKCKSLFGIIPDKYYFLTEGFDKIRKMNIGYIYGGELGLV